MRRGLDALRHTRRKFAAALHLGKNIFRHTPFAQSVGQQVRGRDCVLDRKIDSHTSGRRHCVSGVSNAQQARPVPLPQTVQLHREQFDLIPLFQFVDSIARG